jgi:hypothetical protein
MAGLERDVDASDVAKRIIVVRGQRVLLDSDLAALYSVSAKRLNEQVKRNRTRFPDDFIFTLKINELNILRSQFATSSWGGRRYLPLMFTEHGAITAATILNSPCAVEMSVYIVRVFVKLREVLASNTELARKLEALRNRLRPWMPERAGSSKRCTRRHGP